MGYVTLYFGLILLPCIYFMRGALSPIKNKIGIVFLNDAEIRGGGGLITLYLEIYTFLLVPYKIRAFTHEEMNVYSEPSTELFSEHLTKELMLRDVNYSFFQGINFQNLKYFYRKNFPYLQLPGVWISIPYTFVESVFISPWPIKVKGFLVSQSTLFRVLSHMTGDNNLPVSKRKFILLHFALHGILLLSIPFLPHYVVLQFILFVRRRDIGISGSNDSMDASDVPTTPYLCVNENNLVGRKGNRYMMNSQEYYFHVDSIDNEFVHGTGKIAIRKSIQSVENFPYVGKYGFTLEVLASKEFSIIEKSEAFYSFLPREEFFHEIHFIFRLKIQDSVSILRQSCLQNTELLVSLDTKPFLLLPKSNLKLKRDNWHLTRQSFGKDFRLNFEITLDKSPIRMIYRGIIERNKAQISFQKEVTNIRSVQFKYKGALIPCDQVDSHEDGKILVFHLGTDIPKYSHSEREEVLRVEISGVEDATGCVHYLDKPRCIWFPWVTV